MGNTESICCAGECEDKPEIVNHTEHSETPIILTAGRISTNLVTLLATEYVVILSKCENGVEIELHQK